MIDTFDGLYGLTPDAITADEMAQAQKLVTEKFATEAWLKRVP